MFNMAVGYLMLIFIPCIMVYMSIEENKKIHVVSEVNKTVWVSATMKSNAFNVGSSALIIGDELFIVSGEVNESVPIVSIVRYDNNESKVCCNGKCFKVVQEKELINEYSIQ